MMNSENKTINAPTTSLLTLEKRRDPELFCVYALILDGIAGYVLLPGKELTESESCRQMICSCNTVRSAFPLLTHDEIVDLQPSRGAFVHMPDLEEIQDMLNARTEMGGMVLDMLVDPPDLKVCLQLFYAMIEHKEVAFGSDGRVGRNRLSDAFHVELARPLDDDVLFDTINTLCVRSSLVIAVLDAKRREKRPISAYTHAGCREILDLLVSGRRSRVVKIMRRHLGACIERLEQKFETQ